MQQTTPPNFVVTIGRQFGSGGRELGRLIAENSASLSTTKNYYARRLIMQA